MKAKLLRFAKLALYPLFYLFCLALFGYLTFPVDQLKGRIVAEFERFQRKGKRPRPGEQPMRLQIGELNTYWLSGVEVKDAKLTIPTAPDRKKKQQAALSSLASMGAGGPKAPKKPSTITIKRLTARVRLLPLLVGDVMIDFEAEAFGGKLSGSVPYGDSGDVTVEISGAQLGEIAPLKNMLQGMPILGTASGSVSLTPKKGRFAKADGKLAVQIDNVVLGDGKAELQGVALPAAQVGQIVLEAGVSKGLLRIESFSANGRDFELDGQGSVKLHESWKRASADVYLKFKFADAYRNKNDATRGLLGKPGASFKPAIEIDPRSPFVKAKTADGYYRFNVAGRLDRLEFEPAGKLAGKKKSRRRGKLKRSTGRGRRPLPSLNRRLGAKKTPPKPPAANKGDPIKAAPPRPAAPERSNEEDGAERRGAGADGKRN